jgi:hypothetical protein
MYVYVYIIYTIIHCISRARALSLSRSLLFSLSRSRSLALSLALALSFSQRRARARAFPFSLSDWRSEDLELWHTRTLTILSSRILALLVLATLCLSRQRTRAGKRVRAQERALSCLGNDRPAAFQHGEHQLRPSSLMGVPRTKKSFNEPNTHELDFPNERVWLWPGLKTRQARPGGPARWQWMGR